MAEREGIKLTRGAFPNGAESDVKSTRSWHPQGNRNKNDNSQAMRQTGLGGNRDRCLTRELLPPVNGEAVVHENYRARHR
jgi:hypothetical protein